MIIHPRPPPVAMMATEPERVPAVECRVLGRAYMFSVAFSLPLPRPPPRLRLFRSESIVLSVSRGLCFWIRSPCN